MGSANLVMGRVAHLVGNLRLMVLGDLVTLSPDCIMTHRSSVTISRLSLPLVMSGVVHRRSDMTTLLGDVVHAFLDVMCGHLDLVLSVTVLRMFRVAAILVVLLMDSVAPGVIVVLLLPVLPVLLVPLLLEEMALYHGEADQGHGEDDGELHSDEESLPT